MSVQNYIMNPDLHVRFQPQKYYRFIYVHACAPPVYVRFHPGMCALEHHTSRCPLFVLVPHQIWTKSVRFFVCSLWHIKKKMLGVTLLTDIGPPCARGCTTQVGGAQRRLMVHHVVLYLPVGGAQHTIRSHKPISTHVFRKPQWASLPTVQKTKMNFGMFGNKKATPRYTSMYGTSMFYLYPLAVQEKPEVWFVSKYSSS